MNVRIKLGVFAGVLVVAFGAEFAVGTSAPDGDSEARGVDLAVPPGAAPSEAAVPTASALLPGLAVADRGYTLQVADLTPGVGIAKHPVPRPTGKEASEGPSSKS